MTFILLAINGLKINYPQKKYAKTTGLNFAIIIKKKIQ